MFQKFKLQRKIKQTIREIEAVEAKRSRSQAALVEAILTHSTPKDEDVDYFNLYTAKIENLRKKVTLYKRELAEMTKSDER